MAYYAYINEKNIVTQVFPGKEESNFDWEQYYGNLVGMLCKRTSYNTKGGVYYDPLTGKPAEDQSKAFRKNFAGIGFIYDLVLDAFIPPQPYKSWLLNTQTCLWQAPIPYPQDGNVYLWDEQTQSWVLDN